MIAASTATTTATAAAQPIAPTSGIPEASSEQSATITVLPANTTAPPEVAVERAIDSRSSIPLRSCCLWRVTRNSA